MSPARARLGRKVAEALAQEILRDVAERGLGPGDRLPPESEMLAHYGVARSSLREGLRILEVLGLIDIRTGPGGGPTVRQVDLADFARTASFYFQANRLTMRELVDARLEMEPMLAANAARRRDPELVARLEAANRWAASSLDAPGPDWVTASVEFHRIVTAHSGNPVLDVLAGTLTEIYTARLKASVVPLGHRESVLATHQGITAAIRDGDAAGAERLMRSHMCDYAQDVGVLYPMLIDTVIDWA